MISKKSICFLEKAKSEFVIGGRSEGNYGVIRVKGGNGRRRKEGSRNARRLCLHLGPGKYSVGANQLRVFMLDARA